jgi:predicted kinase
VPIRCARASLFNNRFNDALTVGITCSRYNRSREILNTIEAYLYHLLIILFSGLPGVGKTRLANELAPLISAIVLSTDKLRKELISNPTYSDEEKELIYNIMLLVARYLHNEGGLNCILDATFNTEESRENARKQLAGAPREQIYIVECVCPEDIAISRLRSRKGGNYSDADVGVYRRMKQAYEPVKDKKRRIVADTRRDPELNAEEIKICILFGKEQK